MILHALFELRFSVDYDRLAAEAAGLGTELIVFALWVTAEVGRDAAALLTREEVRAALTIAARLILATARLTSS